jgi:hypothetical protein
MGTDIAEIVLSREAGEPLVSVRYTDGRTAPLPHRLVVHSPTGFAWGYGGSGPADLALNILALFAPDPVAAQHHHDFKWEWIAAVPFAGATLSAPAIRAWLARRESTRQEAP